MVSQKKIQKWAKQFNVAPGVIDKDWVLGHLLNAFYSFDDNKDLFVFKGGTCLKKCYFENYRFSEDLDFTLLDRNFIINKDFVNKITKKVSENTGIKFSLVDIKSQIHNDIQQGYEIKIKFWGANHKPNSLIPVSERWLTYIKLDISFSELILEEPISKKIFHPYSDSSQIIETVPVYPIPEIISEKLRALIQRNRPRDIYDIWYIKNNKIDLNKNSIKNLLLRKAKNKGIEISGIEQFVNDEKRIKNKRAWKSSLNHHLPFGKLPDFDFVYDELKSFIESILKE